MGFVIFKTFTVIFLLTYFYIKLVATVDESTYLLKYLKCLNKIVRFTVQNKDFVGVNLGFGLFLAKVNLKASLNKSNSLTGSIPSFILNTIREIDVPLNYFRKRVSYKNYVYDEKIKKIVSLLNESSWTKKIRKYSNGKLGDSSAHSDFLQYDNLERYLKNVREQPDEIPSPQQSDICLASISENPINTEGQMTHCKIYNSCYGLLLNGTNYGFSFTHRLLFILAGHFGRNCYVFSRHQDEALIQKMCAKALKEAQYIAQHGYQFRDLMMEQIALCTLNGYSEFIQPVWLSKFLELQGDSGCFGVYRDKPCHEHVTGVAAASLAAVIRFLIQEMYDKI